jgi:hypothetical protein
MEVEGQSIGDEREALMALVAFKWLMSGAGWTVDHRRMRADPAYAALCLRRGSDSGCPPLQRRSDELRRLFTSLPEPT